MPRPVESFLFLDRGILDNAARTGQSISKGTTRDRQTDRSICLIEHCRRERPDDRHDEHRAGHPRALGIELLLLPLQRAGTHTRTRHEKHTSQDRADDRSFH